MAPTPLRPTFRPPTQVRGGRTGPTPTPGLRYRAQAHLSDCNALGPGFGVTWAPFKNGKTTLRASAGVFTDWLGSGTYEQTLRVDGLEQHDIRDG